MPVETNPDGIWDIDVTYPVGTETVSTIDNYMRVRWGALLDTFPNVSGAVTASHTELNKLDGMAGSVVGTSDAQTLTNKTIDADNNTISNIALGAECTGASTDLTDTAALTYNADTDVSGNAWVLDEDDFASDSATKVPTQQSVKAYVDASGGVSASSELELMNPFAVSTTASIEHGRAGVPQVVQLFLVCLSDDVGYSAGDILPISSFDYIISGARGMTTYVDANNIQVATGSAVPYLINPSTNLANLITAANWKLVARCLYVG